MDTGVTEHGAKEQMHGMVYIDRHSERNKSF